MDVLLRKAIELHEAGRLDEAEHMYRQILASAPSNPDVLNLLGLIAQAKGVHSEAMHLFYKAVKISPKPPYYFNLGFSLQVLCKPFEAIDAYLKVEAKEAYNNIGNIYMSLGDDAKAEEFFVKALKIDNNYLEAKANLAWLKKDAAALKEIGSALSDYYLALLLQSEPKQALEYALKANEQSTDSNIKALVGSLYINLKEIGKARKFLKEAVALDKNNVPALVNLANIESDESLYKKALEIEPDNFDAHLNYADFLHKQHRLPEALEEYRKAARLNPQSPEVSNNLGVILRDLGEYGQALDLFLNAWSLDKENTLFAENVKETLALIPAKQAKEIEEKLPRFLRLALQASE